MGKFASKVVTCGIFARIDVSVQVTEVVNSTSLAGSRSSTLVPWILRSSLNRAPVMHTTQVS